MDSSLHTTLMRGMLLLLDSSLHTTLMRGLTSDTRMAGEKEPSVRASYIEYVVYHQNKA